MSSQNHASYTVAQLLGNYLPGDLVNVNHALEFGLVILKPVNLYVFNDTHDYAEQTAVEQLVNQGYAAPVVANSRWTFKPQPLPKTKLRTISLNDETLPQSTYGGFNNICPWLLEGLAKRSHDVNHQGDRLDEAVCLAQIVNGMLEDVVIETPQGPQRIESLLSKVSTILKTVDGGLFQEKLKDPDSKNFLDSLARGVSRSRVEARARAAVKRGSFEAMAVYGGPTGGFSYTVGLSAHLGFELVAKGMEPGRLFGLVERAGNQLLKVAHNPESCGVQHLGHLHTASGTVLLRSTYRNVSEVPTIFTDYVTHRVGEVKKVYQLLLADTHNLLPGEPGYDKLFNQDL